MPISLQVLSNGDLIIHDLTFSDMGMFKCIASNQNGEDMQETFVYPHAVSAKLSTSKQEPLGEYVWSEAFGWVSLKDVYDYGKGNLFSMQGMVAIIMDLVAGLW